MAYPEHRSISETALPDVGAHPAPLLAPRAPWVLIQPGDAPWGITGEAVCSLISASGSCCPAGRSLPLCLQRTVSRFAFPKGRRWHGWAIKVITARVMEEDNSVRAPSLSAATKQMWQVNSITWPYTYLSSCSHHLKAEVCRDIMKKMQLLHPFNRCSKLEASSCPLPL